MVSERPTFSIAAWLALQHESRIDVVLGVVVLYGEHHLTFACMRHWFSILLQFKLLGVFC